MTDQSWTEYLPLLLRGALLTVIVTFIAMVGGTVLGFCLAMMRISSSRLMQEIAGVYGTLVRGLPLLVQILLIYFALTVLTGIRMPAVAAGTVAMTLFTGAFMAEII